MTEHEMIQKVLMLLSDRWIVQGYGPNHPSVGVRIRPARFVYDSRRWVQADENRGGYLTPSRLGGEGWDDMHHDTLSAAVNHVVTAVR